MPTLTEISITTRKIIRYTIFGIIALIIGRIALGGLIKIYRYFFPAPPAPPTVAFGKLPSIPFPTGESSEGLTYKLETPDGTLPDLADQSRVYLIQKPSPSLLSLDNAVEKAIGLGYNPTSKEVSQTLYEFEHKNAPSILQYDIGTNTFSISYDLAKDPTPIERIPPAAEVAAAAVRSYLSSADLLPEDLSGPTTNEYLKIEGEKLVSALGQSDADLVKINLFRKSYDDLPSVTARGDESNVWFLISGAKERDRQITAAEFHYFPVDEGQSATYPIKDSQTAWDELMNGQAYIVNRGSDSNVTVRRIYLANYDAGFPSDFFEPVIVFEGDNGFLAYIPAVTSDYYGE